MRARWHAQSWGVIVAQGGSTFYHDLYLHRANDITALWLLQAMQMAEGQRITTARCTINLASGSKDEGDGRNEVEESEVEMVEASMSKMRTERRKGSTTKAKAMPKRMTAVPRNPAHLCGLLTRWMDLVCAQLMEIHSAIRGLEVEHEGLLVEVTEIMEELDGDDLQRSHLFVK